MEIEIITTKKKLTRSILNQMPAANYDLEVLLNCTVLGYIRGVFSYASKCALLKTKGDGRYLLHPLGYESRYTNRKDRWGVTRFYGKYTYTHDFKSESEYERWWKEYKRITRQCRDKQIYI